MSKKKPQTVGDDDESLPAFSSPVNQGVDPTQFLLLLSDWASKHTDLTDEQAEQVKDIVKASSMRLDVYLSLAAMQQQIAFTTRAFIWSDKIERIFFDTNRLATATNEELLAAWREVNKAKSDSLAFLQSLTTRAQPAFVQEVERRIRDLSARVDAVATATPERREDLRSLIAALAKQVGNTHGPQSGDSEPPAGEPKPT